MITKILILITVLLLSTNITDAQNLDALEQITPENISELQQIGVLGRGIASALDWKPDGEVLAVGGATGIWFYDTDFNPIGHWADDFIEVEQLAWSPDGERLAVLKDSQLVVFQADSQILFEDETTASSFSWHPVNNIIATSGIDQPIRLLDANSGELVQEIVFVGEYVAWSPDGTRLAISAGYAQGIVVIDAENFEPTLTINDLEAGGSVQWSFDGSQLSTDCFDEATFIDFVGTCVWDVETGSLISSTELARILWLPENNKYISWGYSPFAAEAGSFIIMNPDDDDSVSTGNGEIMSSLIWHPQNNALTALSIDGNLVEIAFPSGEIVSQNLLHSTTVYTVNISPDATRIATTQQSIVQIWDLSQLEDRFSSLPDVTFDIDLGTYTQPSVEVRWLSADELITIELVSAYGARISRTIARRDANTGEISETLLNYQVDYSQTDSSYNCGSYPSWDYAKVACVVDDELRIYTFDRNEILLSIPVNQVKQIYWSPTNATIIVSRWQTMGDVTSYFIEIYDATNGELLYTVDSDGRRAAPVWNYDMSLVAIPASTEETASIQILDTQTYEVIATISATHATWNPYENLLALSTDNTLAFWTPQAGLLDAELETGKVTAIDWSDDGQFIATSGIDGTIRLWGIPATDE